MAMRTILMILAVCAIAILEMANATGADVWTEVPVLTKHPAATVDASSTSTTESVSFSTAGVYAVRSAILDGIEAVGFHPDNEQGAFFTIRIPDGAAILRPEVTCVATSGTVTSIGVVKWQVEYTVLSATLGATTSTLTNTSRSLASNRLDAVPLGEMSVSGGTYVIGRLYRDADAAIDTCAKTAYVIGFGYWRKE
jgi:hypothetical protein